jgi:hypothetical protein
MTAIIAVCTLSLVVRPIPTALRHGATKMMVTDQQQQRVAQAMELKAADQLQDSARSVP